MTDKFIVSNAMVNAALLARDQDQHVRDMRAAIEAAIEASGLVEEIEDLRTSVLAFCAPYAEKYARDFGFPAGHIHATHYDILKNAGGRMTHFIRHEPEEPPQ
jgi:hypothetical protein